MDRRTGPTLVHINTVPLSFGFLKGQVGYMTGRGMRIVALSSPGDDLDEFGQRNDVRVHAIPMARRITPVQDMLAVWRIYRVLRRLRPDIVHASTPKGGLLGTIAAWLARVPVRIYHIHGLPFMTATGARRLVLRTTERIACRLSSAVLCVSHSIRDVAVSEGLCPASKITVLLGGSCNGVDADWEFNPERVACERNHTRSKLGIPVDAIVMGYVGRIVQDKGIAELVSAWVVLRTQYENLHLLVLGDFEPQDPIPADVESVLRGDPRIHLTGHVREASPMYAAMDVIVLPTYREGFPNVPLEAASMSLPVVATRIPGCVDAVKDGLTGTLVPPRDPVALANAIRTYLDDGGRRRAHGNAGRERVLRDFRQVALWDALHAHYTELMRLSPASFRALGMTP